MLLLLNRNYICLRTTIQIQEIETVCSFTQEHFCSRFLYYFCLCKSFKEHFISALSFLSESGCKGTTFFLSHQTFSKKNSQKHESFRECLQYLIYTLLIYIIHISHLCHFRLHFRQAIHHSKDMGQNLAEDQKQRPRYTQVLHLCTPVAYKERISVALLKLPDP